MKEVSSKVKGFNLTRKERFSYSLIQIPNSIITGIWAFLFLDFFWDNFQMNQTLFVIAQVLFGIVNSLNDFYFGRISDNTNVERWGSRRLVYLKYGGPMWALVFFLTWFPWNSSLQIIVFFNYLIVMCVFDSFGSMIWVVWIALMPELTENVEERNRMGLNNAILGIGGAIPVVISYFIFQSDNGLLLFRIFVGFCALLSAWIYYYASSQLTERKELYINQEQIPLGKSLKDVLKSKAYNAMNIYKVFQQLSVTINTTFAFAFLLWLPDYYIFVAGAIPLITLLGNFLYNILAKIYEIRTLIIWGCLLQIINSVTCFFILLFTDNLIIFWISLFLQGILGGYSFLTGTILSLVIDEDEVVNDQRREGLILGTHEFFKKIGESIAPIFGTYILLAFTFDQNSTGQTPLALLGIKFLFLILPSIFNLISMLGMVFFPYHGDALKEMQDKLYLLHEEKEKQVDDQNK